MPAVVPVRHEASPSGGHRLKKRRVIGPRNRLVLAAADHDQKRQFPGVFRSDADRIHPLAHDHALIGLDRPVGLETTDQAVEPLNRPRAMKTYTVAVGRQRHAGEDVAEHLRVVKGHGDRPRTAHGKTLDTGHLWICSVVILRPSHQPQQVPLGVVHHHALADQRGVIDLVVAAVPPGIDGLAPVAPVARGGKRATDPEPVIRVDFDARGVTENREPPGQALPPAVLGGSKHHEVRTVGRPAAVRPAAVQTQRQGPALTRAGVRGVAQLHRARHLHRAADRLPGRVGPRHHRRVFGAVGRRRSHREVHLIHVVVGHGVNKQPRPRVQRRGAVLDHEAHRRAALRGVKRRGVQPPVRGAVLLDVVPHQRRAAQPARAQRSLREIDIKRRALGHVGLIPSQKHLPEAIFRGEVGDRLRGGGPAAGQDRKHQEQPEDGRCVSRLHKHFENPAGRLGGVAAAARGEPRGSPPFYRPPARSTHIGPFTHFMPPRQTQRLSARGRSRPHGTARVPPTPRPSTPALVI